MRSLGQIDDAGNISLQTQEALQRGVTIGVLRFENALEKEIDEKAKLNLQELSQGGVDGVILTKDGKPVEAMTTDESRLFKGIFQAAAGLERKYLCVSYEEKEAVKELGALWDGKVKSWYIPEGLDSKSFAAWESGRSNTADNPQEKFAEFVREIGGNLRGELPIMDGQIHRIPEIGGKPGNKNISYVGHLDGVPAGWVKNFRGAEGKWKMEGVVLTKEDREKLQKEATEKQQQRQKERLALYEQKAKESQDYVQGLEMATGQEGYFKEKGIAPSSLTVRKDQSGHIVVPLVDASGKQWSFVTLQKNGFKQILKDSRAQGTFHVIGAENHEQITGPVLLCEGYSTGAAINELTGMPVVCCTTSNNLEHVAVALKEKHPEQAFVILGDNDAYLEAEGKINSGQTKARAAAAAVDGSVFFPDFGEDKPDKHQTDFLDMARLMGKEHTRQYIEIQTELADAKKEVVQEKAQEKEKEEKRETEKETSAQMER